MIILRIVKTLDDMEKAITSSLDCHQIFVSSCPLVFNTSVSITYHCTVLILHTLKTPENLWVSNIFSEYRSRLLAYNGLMGKTRKLHIQIRTKSC